VLGRWFAAWRARPEGSPRVISVYGSPGAQIVIGAVKVDQRSGEQIESDGRKWRVRGVRRVTLADAEPREYVPASTSAWAIRCFSD
jgi:predicted transcriptional regulator